MGQQQPQPVERPHDLIPIEDVAELLERSRRSLERWSSDVEGLPTKIPRYAQPDIDGSSRTLLSWSEVLLYCEAHNKVVPPGARQWRPQATGIPDAKLSERLAATASDTAATPPDTGGATSSDGGRHTATSQAALRAVSQPHPAHDRHALSPATAHDRHPATGHDRARQENPEASLRRQLLEAELRLTAAQAEVSRLEQRLHDVQQAHERQLTAQQAAHQRELHRLESLLGQQSQDHRAQREELLTELRARRTEAQEARAAAERQRQREAALRWQAGELRAQRDQSVALLQEWRQAGALKRLFSRPPAALPGAEEPPTEPQATTRPVIVEIEPT